VFCLCLSYDISHVCFPAISCLPSLAGNSPRSIPVSNSKFARAGVFEVHSVPAESTSCSDGLLSGPCMCACRSRICFFVFCSRWRRYNSATNNAIPTGTPIPAPIAAAWDLVPCGEPAVEEVGAATAEAAMEEVANEIVVDVGCGVDTEDDRDDEDLLLAAVDEAVADEVETAVMTVTVE